MRRRGVISCTCNPFQLDWTNLTAADSLMKASHTTQTPQEAELARLLVETLNLEVTAETIDPEMPLYDEGLGLDSIDMLEISLVVSQRFGVKLRADDEHNVRIFSSLRSLNAYIQSHREP